LEGDMGIPLALAGFVLWCGLWLFIYDRSGDMVLQFDLAWTNIGVRAQFLLKHPLTPNFQSEWWIGYAVCMVASYLLLLAMALVVGAFNN
jgi:hypothetical protein